MATKVKRKRFIEIFLCYNVSFKILISPSYHSVLILPPDDNTAANTWSDRQLAAAGKPLTGIAVKKTRDGVFISRIRAR